MITLQAFINVCSPPDSIVVDLNYGTCICIHPSLIVSYSKFILQSNLFLTFVFYGFNME